MNLCDRLAGNLLWFLVICIICFTQMAFAIILKPNPNDNLNKAPETSPQINLTKFKLNSPLDSKSTYSSALSSASSHFTSSSSSSASSSSSSSSSSSESQANEDVLATSDVSLGAQVANNALLIVSDELIDSGPETRTDRTDNKLDKNKLLIELTTEVNLNLKQTTSISDNLPSVNDMLLREDDYLHQHLEPNLHPHHLLNDYLIADLDKSAGDFKSAEFKSSYKVTKNEDKLNNEPIIYSSSNRPLDTGHAVFTPIQPPPPNTIDLDSSQPNIPDFNYPLDFSSKNLNNKMQQAIHQNFNSSVHSTVEEPETTKKSGKIENVVGVCRDGLVVPAWRPLYNLTGYDRFLRGLVYFFALCYLFIGVSIIADR